MTVGELLEALKQFAEDDQVVIANYEFGFDRLAHVQAVEVVRADEGEAEFVMASKHTNGAPRIRLVCIGPTEPSRLSSEEININEVTGR